MWLHLGGAVALARLQRLTKFAGDEPGLGDASWLVCAGAGTPSVGAVSKLAIWIARATFALVAWLRGRGWLVGWGRRVRTQACAHGDPPAGTAEQLWKHEHPLPLLKCKLSMLRFEIRSCHGHKDTPGGAAPEAGRSAVACTPGVAADSDRADTRRLQAPSSHGVRGRGRSRRRTRAVLKEDAVQNGMWRKKEAFWRARVVREEGVLFNRTASRANCPRLPRDRRHSVQIEY